MLSSPSENASEPRLGMDSNGNMVAIWIENGALYSKTRPYGKSWDKFAEQISRGPVLFPQLVIDMNGNTTSIWVENDVIKTSTKLWGENWTIPLPLSQSGATQPQLGVDNQGDVIAVWVRNTVIESATKLFGMSWPVTCDILSGSGANAPQISVGSNGDVIAVWHGDDTVNTIYAARKSTTLPWSTAQAISNPSIDSICPSVTVDGNGNATAAWFVYNLNENSYRDVAVYAAKQNLSSDNWTYPIKISSQTGVYNPSRLFLKIASDALGNVIALWQNSTDGATFNLQANILPFDQSWVGVQSLVLNNLYSLSGDLTINSAGYALATYMYNEGNLITIQGTGTGITALNYINFWETPQTISIQSPNGYPKSASALIGDVNAIGVVWINSDGNLNTIQNSNGVETVVLAPSNVSISQTTMNWNIFTEYYNTLSWKSSPSSEIIGYLIARNGLLVTQVDSTITEWIDHNRDPSVKDTYSIVAIDKDQDQSIPVSVKLP